MDIVNSASSGGCNNTKFGKFDLSIVPDGKIFWQDTLYIYS